MGLMLVKEWCGYGVNVSKGVVWPWVKEWCGYGVNVSKGVVWIWG